jgi:hypothetical protein
LIKLIQNKQQQGTTKVFAKAWQTEDQSAENPYCTASGLDRTLIGSCRLTCAFNYLFGTSSGLDQQKFQAFANTRSLAASLLTALLNRNPKKNKLN